jgi:hypothetical protein
MISKYDVNTRLDMCIIECDDSIVVFHSGDHTGQIWYERIQRMCTMQNISEKLKIV